MNHAVHAPPRGEASARDEAARDATRPVSDPARDAFTLERRAHWDAVARRLGDGRGTGRYYRQRLAEVYRHLVPPGLRVLELGAGRGDLLAALAPKRGVGVDFSQEMLSIARRRHPSLTFVEGDVHDVRLDETFDVVIVSDLVDDLWDVQEALENVRRHCAPDARVIFNHYSRVWEPPLSLARATGLANPLLRQSWLAPADLDNLLELAGFEPLRRFQDLLWPLRTPGVDRFCNAVLSKVEPLRHLSSTNFAVARPRPATRRPPPRVSVIVPARNEQGNIDAIFARTPELGAGTELIFVEGHSKDDTWGAIQRAIAANPGRNVKAFQQTGKGKGDAVRLGFAHATGDVLVILDADLTVPPEALPRFIEALENGMGDLVNGVRLVYPMEDKAMRFLNLLGNKFFALSFSWLLDQDIKDTLCGTKVLRREHYERIAANRSYFGDFDPFGDFDLLFGAAKQSMKIVDMPVRYRERTYGETNIQRFREGAILLRMVAFAARRIKLV